MKRETPRKRGEEAYKLHGGVFKPDSWANVLLPAVTQAAVWM
jgi:hypothetical protein